MSLENLNNKETNMPNCQYCGEFITSGDICESCKAKYNISEEED